MDGNIDMEKQKVMKAGDALNHRDAILFPYPAARKVKSHLGFCPLWSLHTLSFFLEPLKRKPLASEHVHGLAAPRLDAAELLPGVDGQRQRDGGVTVALPCGVPAPGVGHAGHALDHAEAPQVGQHVRALRQDHRLVLDAAFELRHGLAIPALRDHDLFHLRGAVLLPGELRERAAVAPGVERQPGKPGQPIYYMEEDMLLRAVRAVSQFGNERRGQRQILPLRDRPEDGEVTGAPEVAADKVTAPGGQLGKQRVDVLAQPLPSNHLGQRHVPVHEILGGRRPR